MGNSSRRRQRPGLAPGVWAAGLLVVAADANSVAFVHKCDGIQRPPCRREAALADHKSGGAPRREREQRRATGRLSMQLGYPPLPNPFPPIRPKNYNTTMEADELAVRFVNSADPEFEDKVVVCKEGASVMWVADQAGVKIPTACRNGLCGTCTTDLEDPNWPTSKTYRPGHQPFRACIAKVVRIPGCEEMVLDVYRGMSGASKLRARTSPEGLNLVAQDLPQAMDRFEDGWEKSFAPAYTTSSRVNQPKPPKQSPLQRGTPASPPPALGPIPLQRGPIVPPQPSRRMGPPPPRPGFPPRTGGVYRAPQSATPAATGNWNAAEQQQRAQWGATRSAAGTGGYAGPAGDEYAAPATPPLDGPGQVRYRTRLQHMEEFEARMGKGRMGQQAAGDDQADQFWPSSYAEDPSAFKQTSDGMSRYHQKEILEGVLEEQAQRRARGAPERPAVDRNLKAWQEELRSIGVFTDVDDNLRSALPKAPVEQDLTTKGSELTEEELAVAERDGYNPHKWARLQEAKFPKRTWRRHDEPRLNAEERVLGRLREAPFDYKALSGDMRMQLSQEHPEAFKQMLDHEEKEELIEQAWYKTTGITPPRKEWHDVQNPNPYGPQTEDPDRLPTRPWVVAPPPVEDPKFKSSQTRSRSSTEGSYGQPKYAEFVWRQTAPSTPCERCRGSGQVSCSVCKGQGIINEKGRDGVWRPRECHVCMTRAQVGCEACNGRGKFWVR